MRKLIIGGLIGFVLATAASANAQEASRLIDQIVQGVFPVTVEGNAIGDAVVIDNKTYLPVREFGEAVGYTVTFTDDREVVLTKNVETTTPVIPEVTPQPGISVTEQINDLKNKIEIEKGNIKVNEAMKEMYTNSLNDHMVSKKSAQEFIDMHTKNVADSEAKIAQYEQKIAALQK